MIPNASLSLPFDIKRQTRCSLEIKPYTVGFAFKTVTKMRIRFLFTRNCILLSNSTYSYFKKHILI